MSEDLQKTPVSTEAAKPPAPFMARALDVVSEFVHVVLISLAIIIPVRYFLIQPFYVKGASMEPNFMDKEYLIIDEISYRFHEAQRGDIVVFRYPNDPRQFFIKRVIGLPGETIKIDAGKVWIIDAQHPNGRILDEHTYLASNVATLGEKTFTLDKDQYFVLGDNRGASLDSRIFGPVSESLVVGRVWIRGWPPERINVYHPISQNLTLQ